MAPGADLVVTQTASPQPDGAIRLTVKVRNAGPSPSKLRALRELVSADGYAGITHTPNRRTTCMPLRPAPGYTMGQYCQTNSLPGRRDLDGHVQVDGTAWDAGYRRRISAERHRERSRHEQPTRPTSAPFIGPSPTWRSVWASRALSTSTA
jgi:hypothetical protein